MNEQSINLKNSFLISMPNNKSKYQGALIYICHHGLFGSMGFVINQVFPMDLKTMLAHLNIASPQHNTNQILYSGGETQSDRGFVLHPFDPQDNYNASYCASDDLTLTSSTDILEAMASGKGPKESLIALGYMSWQPGVLESEIIDNLWLNCPANLDIIFNVAAKDKMQAAATTLGISLEQLSNHIGNA